MMITHLSEDLVEEILARVPATSLKRLRSTCKQWNAFFKDERFANKQFAKAAKQFELLTLKENRVYSMSANLHEILNNVAAAPSIEFKCGLSLKNSHKTWKRVNVFHCDGLLLCTNDCSIVVWNPCLGETRWIQPNTVYEEYPRFALGRSSFRSYKILKYWSHKDQNGRLVYEFELFGLSSDSWRVLDVDNSECIIDGLTGVSLKGNTYWFAFENNKGLLLGFDFSTEVFRCLCLPFQDSVRDTIALSVVREEELLVLHQSMETLTLDVWVTTNFDQTKALSWSKFLAVDLYTHNCRLSSYLSFFIDEEKKVAMCIGKLVEWNIGCIIGKDGKYREFSFVESMMMPFVSNYVPSLVHIQQG